MANIIDSSYFFNELLIPVSDSRVDIDRINYFIAKYEPQLLNKCLGVAFYNMLKTNMANAQSGDRWYNLLNGCTYNTQDGKTYSWVGFKDTNNPFIANYVYYFYMRDSASQSSVVGEAITNTQNATRTSPAQKIARAWNETILWTRGRPHTDDSQETGYLWHMLQYAYANGSLVYPEFEINDVDYKGLLPISAYGI